MIKYFLTFVIGMHLLFAKAPIDNNALFSEAIETLNNYNGQSNRLDRVKEIYNLLNTNSPNDPNTLILKAKLLFQYAYISHDDYNNAMLSKALDICKKVTQDYPKRIEAYFLSAAVYIDNTELKSYDKAKEMLDKVKAIEPENIKVLLAYATLESAYKHNQNAIKYAKEALQKAKKTWHTSSANNILTEVYVRTKQYDKADEAYRNIIRLDPSSPWALVNYSSFLRRRKNYDAAIEYAKKSIALSNFGMGKVVLSKAYYEKGHQLHWVDNDKVHSRKWFELGIKAYPNSLKNHYGLASSYQHTGYKNHSVADIKKAQKEYQICQKIKPGYTLAKNELKKIKKLLQRLGQ